MHKSQAMLSSQHNREKMFTMGPGPSRLSLSEERASIGFTRSREFVHSAAREASSERKLENISSDLKMQAESLNKWKMSTEFRLKQAEDKSRQLVQTEKTQLQTILNLKVDNESLHIRLQEEANLREELCQKHERTGTLCQVIKMQYDEVTQKLDTFERLDKELVARNAYYIGSIEELTVKFDNLRLKKKEMREDLTNKLVRAEEDFKMKEKAILVKLRNIEEDKKNLQERVDEHMKTIDKYKEDMILMEEELYKLRNDSVFYTNQLKEKQLFIEEHSATIVTMKKDIITMSEEIEKLVGDKETLIRELNENKSVLQTYFEDNNNLKNQEQRLLEEINTLKQENGNIEQHLKKQEIHLQECTESNDRLKLQVQALLMDITKFQDENNDLMKQLNDKDDHLHKSLDANIELKNQESTLMQKVMDLTEEKESLMQKFKHEQETLLIESQTQKETFTKEMEEKQTELQLKNEELENHQKLADDWLKKCQEAEKREESLKVANGLLTLELKEMQNRLEDLSAVKGEVVTQVDVLKKTKNDLHIQVEKYVLKLKEVQEELEELRCSLKAEAEDHQTDKASLVELSHTYQQCLEEKQKLKEQLENKTDNINKLLAANKKLQSDLVEAVDEKNHTIKDYNILLKTKTKEKAQFEKELEKKDQCLEDNATELSHLDRQLKAVLADMKQKDAELDSLRSEAGYASKENSDKIKALQRQLEILAQNRDDEIKSWELKLHVANRTKEVELKNLETDHLYNQQIQNQKVQEAMLQKEKCIKDLQEELESLCNENKIFKATEVKMKRLQTEQDKELKSLKKQIDDLLETKNSEITTLKNDLQSFKHNKEEEIKLLHQQNKSIQDNMQLQINELKSETQDLIQEKQRWLQQLEQQMEQLRPPSIRQAPQLPLSPDPFREVTQLKTPGRKFSQCPPTPRQCILETPKPIEISEDERNGWNEMFSKDEIDNMEVEHDVVTPRQRNRSSTPNNEDRVQSQRKSRHNSEQDDQVNQKATPKLKKKARSKSPPLPKTPSVKHISQSEVKDVKKRGGPRKATPEPRLPSSKSARVSTTASKVSASLIQNSVRPNVTLDHPPSQTIRKCRVASPANLKSLRVQSSPLHSDSSECIEGELLQRRLCSAGLQVGLVSRSPRTPRYDNTPDSSPQSKKKKGSLFTGQKTPVIIKPKANVRRADNFYRGERKFFKSTGRPVVVLEEESWNNNADDIFKFQD